VDFTLGSRRQGKPTRCTNFALTRKKGDRSTLLSLRANCVLIPTGRTTGRKFFFYWVQRRKWSSPGWFWWWWIAAFFYVFLGFPWWVNMLQNLIISFMPASLMDTSGMFAVNVLENVFKYYAPIRVGTYLLITLLNLYILSPYFRYGWKGYVLVLLFPFLIPVLFPALLWVAKMHQMHESFMEEMQTIDEEEEEDGEKKEA
jgi:hypothetical protein